MTEQKVRVYSFPFRSMRTIIFEGIGYARYSHGGIIMVSDDEHSLAAEARMAVASEDIEEHGELPVSELLNLLEVFQETEEARMKVRDAGNVFREKVCSNRR